MRFLTFFIFFLTFITTMVRTVYVGGVWVPCWCSDVGGRMGTMLMFCAGRKQMVRIQCCINHGIGVIVDDVSVQKYAINLKSSNPLTSRVWNDLPSELKDNNISTMRFK